MRTPAFGQSSYAASSVAPVLAPPITHLTMATAVLPVGTHPRPPGSSHECDGPALFARCCLVFRSYRRAADRNRPSRFGPESDEFATNLAKFGPDAGRHAVDSVPGSANTGREPQQLVEADPKAAAVHRPIWLGFDEQPDSHAHRSRTMMGQHSATAMGFPDSRSNMDAPGLDFGEHVCPLRPCLRGVRF